MSYIFSIIAENDHNQIHEMILVFEKLFQPDNCDIATFSIFIYTIYNLCLNSDESEQNKKYVLSFAQNFSAYRSPHTSVVVKSRGSATRPVRAVTAATAGLHK